MSSVERSLVLKALLAELPVHLIGHGFYLVSNEIQALDKNAVNRLRLLATLVLRERGGQRGHTDLRRPIPLVKLMLRLLDAGQTTEYRNAETKRHTRKVLLGPATLETLK